MLTIDRSFNPEQIQNPALRAIAIRMVEDAKRQLPPVLPPRAPSDLPSADEASKANITHAETALGADVPQLWVMESDTSTGKSRAAVSAVVHKVSSDPDARILVSLESHLMASETKGKLLDEAAALGVEINVMTWLGEEQIDPRFSDMADKDVRAGAEKGQSLNRMCRRNTARKAARSVGSARSACKGCPFNAEYASPRVACGSTLQSSRRNAREFAEAQIVLVAGTNALLKKMPNTLKRASDWRPAQRDALGGPVLGEAGEVVRNEHHMTRGEMAAENGGHFDSVCELDFTDIWVDEIQIASLVVRDLGRFDALSISRLKPLLQNALQQQPKVAVKAIRGHLRFGVSAEKAKRVREAMDEAATAAGAEFDRASGDSAGDAAGSAGDITLTIRRSKAIIDAQVAAAEGVGVSIAAVLDTCAPTISKLQNLLLETAHAADIEGKNAPGSISAQAIHDSGIGIRDLHHLAEVARAARLSVEGDFGLMTAEEIEEVGAPIRDHNRSVGTISTMVQCIADAADAAISSEVELARSEARVEGNDEAFMSLFADEDTAGKRRLTTADPLPGVELGVKTRETETLEGEKEVSHTPFLQLADKRSISHLARNTNVLLTSAARPSEEIRHAFGDSFVKLGDVQTREGEGVTRMKIADFTASKVSLVPPADETQGGSQAENCVRAMLDALNTLSSAGHALTLDNAQAAPVGSLEGQSQRAGLITFKGSRKYLEGAFPELDRALIMGHHGAVTGSNAWENVPALSVVGRASVSPRDAERAASVLAQTPVDRLEPEHGGAVRFPKHPVTGAEYHPDPNVELVRSSIAEDALFQEDARSRSSRRTKDNPCTINIVTSTPINRHVDSQYSKGHWTARAGCTAPALALGVWPAAAEGGEYSLRGWSFQIIGRALNAYLGNVSGEISRTEFNPSLLVSDAPSATATHCSKVLHDRIRGNEHLRDLIGDIDAIFEAGQGGEKYLAGGSLPFCKDGWHKVEVTQDGRSASMWAKGDDTEAARRRAEAVLSMGTDAMRAQLEGSNTYEGAEAKALENVIPKEERAAAVAMEVLGKAWKDHRMLGLSVRSMAHYAPEAFGSRGAAHRALEVIKEYHANVPLSGGQNRAGENRAFFENVQTVVGSPYKNCYKGDPNNSGTLQKKCPKTPAAENAVFDGAFMLAATADEDGSEPAVLVEFTPERKGAKKVKMLLKAPLEFTGLAKELAIYFELGQMASQGDDLQAAVRDAEAKVARLSSKLKDAEAAIDAKTAEIEAAKLAQKEGVITKAAMVELRAEKKPLREHRDDVKRLLAAAKKALAAARKADKAGPQTPTGAFTMETWARTALEHWEPRGVKNFKLLHVYPAGIHFDWASSFRAELEAETKTSQPQGECTAAPIEELTGDEGVAEGSAGEIEGAEMFADWVVENEVEEETAFMLQVAEFKAAQEAIALERARMWEEWHKEQEEVWREAKHPFEDAA